MTPEQIKLLQKQQYEVIGEHSAVKICTWTKKSIRDEGVCYKQQFYGINSHRCCQMTPNMQCSNRCIYCWRDMDFNLGTGMNDKDDPDEIINRAILAQRKLISGFGGYKMTNMKKWKEAQDPIHFAISLSGEPTGYKRLPELIKKLHKRNFSSFVVTNGEYPEQLEKVTPTQLYLSVDSPTKEDFMSIDRPLFKDGWKRFLESCDVMKHKRKKTRTALRLTLVKGINMANPEGYAELIRRAKPLFLELKAYMYVGSSRSRLDIGNMPLHSDVAEFSQKIADAAGYKIIDEKKESRVTLLMEDDFEGRIMKF